MRTGMTIAVMAVCVAACELEPAPKKTAAPAAETGNQRATGAGAGSATGAAAGSGSATGAGSGSATAAGSAATARLTQACIDVGVKFAEVYVATAEGNEKATLERERAQIVRQIAEQCSASGWSDEIVGCFKAARTRPELETCTKLVRQR